MHVYVKEKKLGEVIPRDVIAMDETCETERVTMLRRFFRRAATSAAKECAKRIPTAHTLPSNRRRQFCLNSRDHSPPVNGGRCTFVLQLHFTATPAFDWQLAFVLFFFFLGEGATVGVLQGEVKSCTTSASAPRTCPCCSLDFVTQPL